MHGRRAPYSCGEMCEDISSDIHENSAIMELCRGAPGAVIRGSVGVSPARARGARQRRRQRDVGTPKRSGRRAMSDDRRLIEAAFPLWQVSLDSVHEKNARRGHISTLHIWPARRLLAACRAALLAALLPDAGDSDGRRRLLRRIAGRVIEERDGEGREKETTEGGVCRWGREGNAGIGAFRKEVRKAFGGRAPKGAGPVRGRRSGPAGSHAAGLRGDGGGHQPRGAVHPALHAPLPACDGRGRRARPRRTGRRPAVAAAASGASRKRRCRIGNRRYGVKWIFRN